jgi:hypothetical protein
MSSLCRSALPQLNGTGERHIESIAAACAPHFRHALR